MLMLVRQNSVRQYSVLFSEQQYCQKQREKYSYCENRAHRNYYNINTKIH